MNKFEGLMNAHPRKRYKSFVTTIADTEMVWLDCDPNQLVPTEQCPHLRMAGRNVCFRSLF